MNKVKKEKLSLNGIRIFLVLFVLMFVTSLFIGIKAFAESNLFKLNNVLITDKSDDVTGSISSFSDSEIINDITFHKVDGFATFKLELKSNIDKEITILDISDDNSSSYITYEYDKHENEKVEAKATFNFIVKAIYKNELTDVTKRDQTNNVKFQIKYIEDGEEKSEEIIINPTTKDTIGISFILLFISSTGLIICTVINKKKKHDKLSKVTVVVLTGLVIAPIVAKAATIAFTFSLNTSIGIYDKVVVTFDSGSSETTKFVTYGGKLDNLPTVSKTGYSFVKWINEDGTDFDVNEELSEDKMVKAVWSINSYTITFDTDGGTTIPPITQEYNTDITIPSDPTKNMFIFEGWNPEIPSKMPAEDITITAQWREIDILCRRATNLSVETCQIDSSNAEGCRGDGYAYGDKIIYGSVALTQQLSVGNALDCNVDGTGYNQRFYYIRTLNGNAVLISNINFEGSGQGVNANYHYDEALTKLPRKEDQWTKLPITFTNDGDDTVYAARFITLDDLKAMVGKDDVTTSNVFNGKYNFIFENTSYANVSDPEHRSTVWIKQEGDYRSRYHKKNRAVDPLTSTNFNTSVNAVRPVIEVPLDKIDISTNDNEVMIVFYGNNGTAPEVRTYTKGNIVNNLPEPTKDGYQFMGWYTENTFENKVSNGSTLNESMVLYAKWYISNAVAEYNGTGYTSIASALSKINSNDEATITLLKDTQENVSIPSNKNVVIDLNGHTLSNNGDNQVIYNQGTVTVKNGTITTDAETKAAIDNVTSRIATISNVVVNANGKRSAIYNSKGTTIINGGSVLNGNNDYRPTIMNSTSSSILYVVDATIISVNKNALDNNGGVIVIGSQDENINAPTPVIIGGTYGIATTVNINMYDGIIKGVDGPVFNGKATTGNNPITYSGGSVNNNRVIASEAGFVKKTGTDGSYNTLFLEAE